MLNNREKPDPVFRFDSHIYPPTDWKHYRLYMRPDVWWNAYDGFKIGFNLNGNYMNVKNNFSFTAWVNTHLATGGSPYNLDATEEKKAGWFSYRFDYSDAIDKIIKHGTVYVHSQWLDGLQMYKLGLTKLFPTNILADVDLKGFSRVKQEWTNYLLYPAEWGTTNSVTEFNASVNLSATYTYSRDKFSGYLTGHLRSGMAGASYNYNYFELTSVYKLSAWRLDIRTREYGRIGAGNNVPSESALFLAGGNPEEMMDNKYYRAAGFAPPGWVGEYGADINHVQFGGGLNIRGYAGYLLHR